MRKYKFLLILVGLLVLLLSASPMVIPSRKVDWFVLGSSAANLQTGAIKLDTLVGQHVVGKGGGGDIELGSGYFYYADTPPWKCFMPMFLK